MILSLDETKQYLRVDNTELRTITRDDLVQWDPAAMVYGQLQI